MCLAGHTVAMVIYCVTMIVAHQVIKSNYNVSSKSNKKNPFAFANKHNAFSPILHYTTRKKDIANALQAGAIWKLKLHVLVWTMQDVLKKIIARVLLRQI